MKKKHILLLLILSIGILTSSFMDASCAALSVTAGDKYGLKDSPQYKQVLVFCNSDINEFCSLLKSEGFDIDKSMAINKLTEVYIQDRNLIIISGDYRYDELPPFITKDLKVRDYHGIDAADEHLLLEAGKATVLIVEKALKSQAFDYLSQSVRVDHASAGIKEIAAEITKGANTDYEKAKAIYKWICGNISYESYYSLAVSGQDWTSLTYASNVLISRKTNCSGYSNLYAALNRAAGIKARIVCGWTYDPNNEESKFKNEYRHAWNEVFANDRWISVDTTMGAAPPLKGTYTYFDTVPEVFYKDHIREGEYKY